ncbi:DotU family type IV/VI secretion system protein [Escherichia coli]|uniref:DotU family type IV/VI secretion system protein n=1 Tax=Escherichia coli TaxID=562 RepID=UPI002351D660|nr:DotU family type IV/VI secretion system protein [Escherichia coli]
MDEGSLSLPPFTGYDEKSLRDYHLALRGNSLNPMIDAATPLLGMVMRLSTMNSQTMPEHLFAQVVTDVQAVEQLLQEQGYEPGVIISFRYILCTFIDEAALGTGADNAAGKLTFNIDGLARAIAPLRDACHWAGE